MNRFQQIILHLAGWAIFITLPILLFPGPKDILALFSGSRSIILIMLNVFLISYFYLNYHLIVPKYYFNKQYGKLTLVTLSIYVLIVVLPGLIIPYGPAPDMMNTPPLQERMPPPGFMQNHAPDMKPPGNTMQKPELLREFTFRLGRQSLFFMLVFLFSLMLRINNRLRETDAAHQKAEIAYLHAQINPHFLFNTLNSIYSLALQKADATAQAVVKLSNMMRYVITDAVHDKVSLFKELTYLNNYIELQRMRLPASVALQVNINTNAFHQRPGVFNAH